MLKLGIIGFPLEHSLSPIMQTAAMQQLNISGEYKAFEIKEEDLEKVFNDLKKNELRGFNVTIPYKTKIIPFLDELTLTAQLIGAVNTVTIESNGKTIGDNTDVTGFWGSIPDEYKKKMPEITTSVLGCGGSASAICLALIQNNLNTLKIYGRNKQKLEKFKDVLLRIKEKTNSKTNIETNVLKNINLTDSSILINTTPLGMYPDINNSPVEKDRLVGATGQLPLLVYDIIYNPKETMLLKYAKELNLKTMNGIEMLIGQGHASLCIWLGKEVSALGAMRMAMESL